MAEHPAPNPWISDLEVAMRTIAANEVSRAFKTTSQFSQDASHLDQDKLVLKILDSEKSSLRAQIYALGDALHELQKMFNLEYFDDEEWDTDSAFEEIQESFGFSHEVALFVVRLYEKITEVFQETRQKEYKNRRSEAEGVPVAKRSKGL
jgi:hypothetical protein